MAHAVRGAGSPGRSAGRSPSSRSQISACSRSSAAIAVDLRATPLGVVGRLLVALERLDQVGDRARPEQPGGQDDEPDAHPRAGRRGGTVGAELAQLARPRSRRGGARCRRSGGTRRRGADPSRCRPARRTGRSRRAPASGCRGSGRRRSGARPIVGHRRRVDSRLDDARRDRRPLRYLDRRRRRRRRCRDLDERLRLAERTMIALVARRRAAAKIGVHPRPDGIVRPRDAGLPPRRGPRRAATTCSG